MKNIRTRGRAIEIRIGYFSKKVKKVEGHRAEVGII